MNEWNMNEIESIKEKSTSYLSFVVDKEVFATHVAHITNIVEVPKITKVPRSPDYMEGVINLRGTVLPVIDLKMKFGLGKAEYTSNTCILVSQVKIGDTEVQVGTIVDTVKEVIEIDSSGILPPPHHEGIKGASFINGIVERNDGLLMLLDMNEVFNISEIKLLKKQVDKITKSDKKKKEK
jgi:purine-binding chemotaxis protein CheW